MKLNGFKIWIDIMYTKIWTNIMYGFYSYIVREQHFVNLEDDIVYFKAKGEGIVFYIMNGHTRKHDSQQYFMPPISRMQEDTHMYDNSSMDEKDPIHMESHF